MAAETASMELNGHVDNDAVADQSSSDTESEIEWSDDDEWDAYKDERPLEKWRPTISAIMDATRNAAASSPGVEQIDGFREYWRGVFTRLADEVDADSEIPRFLTEWPVKKFTVFLFEEQHPGMCPCCLPYVDESILLENPEGVTKRDLVTGLMEYLYGETGPPMVYDRAGDPTEMVGPVVYDRNWMTKGKNEGGEPHAYSGRNPKIWLYCCPLREFAERKETLQKRNDEAAERKSKKDEIGLSAEKGGEGEEI